MRTTPGSLELLLHALTCLPGVGKKSALRMTWHLLQHDRAGGLALADALHTALNSMQNCSRCRTFCDEHLCSICADSKRNKHQLCIVESTSDQWALERSGAWHGQYFVLQGRIDASAGIGPEQLGFPLLFERLLDDEIHEVVIATSFTTEGEVTAHLIQDTLNSSNAVLATLAVSRLARGIPIGSELEYLDAGSLAWAIADRR